MSGTWWNAKWDEDFYGISGSWSNTRYPIISGPMQFHSLDNREHCEYCHGYTKMDDRGNCMACGAPKVPQGYLRY